MNKSIFSVLTFLVVLVFISLFFLYQRYSEDTSVYLPVVGNYGGSLSSFILDESSFLDQPMPIDYFFDANPTFRKHLETSFTEESEYSKLIPIYRATMKVEQSPTVLFFYESDIYAGAVYRAGEKAGDRSCYVVHVDKRRSTLTFNSSSGFAEIAGSFASACNDRMQGYLDSKTIPKISFYDYLRVKVLKCFSFCEKYNGVWVSLDSSDFRLKTVRQILVREFIPLSGKTSNVDISLGRVFLSSDYCVVDYTVVGGELNGYADMASFECSDEVTLLSRNSPTTFHKLFSVDR